MKEEIEALPEIEEGKYDVNSMYIYDLGEKFEAKLLIRNATDEFLSFKELPLMITTGDGGIVFFDLVDVSTMSEIPAMSIRPYTVYLNKESIVQEFCLDDKCNVKIFEEAAEVKEAITLQKGYIDEKFSNEEQLLITYEIERMPPIEKGEPKPTLFKKGIDEKGNRYVALMVCNANPEDIEINNYRIAFYDFIGLIKAQYSITEPIKVSAERIEVFKIIIEDSDILGQDFDIENCKMKIKKIKPND
jgi:SLAP domain-containing protein